jgi:hypothetical protein
VKPAKPAARKDGADPMREMRERYDRLVEADKDNRVLGTDDLRFVAVPGNQWEAAQKKARKNRPCYEFPILRSHWRQIVNDQKKARPAIKVRALKDATAEGAELRQGLIRNIESVCCAERAYDAAFELLVAAGMGAWRVTTQYSEDDGWEQDFAIKPIKDALNSVWLAEDRSHGFVEESIPRATFEARYPNADAASFQSGGDSYGDWFGEDEIRVAEYWRKVPVTRELLLLSDGRTVEAEEFAAIADEQAAQGVTVSKTRKVAGHKVVMSIVSGAEEIEGPFESVFHEIPIVLLYANKHFVDGQWHWMGLVRPSRDPQKLLNYNFTAGQEMLAKQNKATPLVTPKMLEGKGVKAMWDASNAADAPYLPYTPDPLAPSGKPDYMVPPQLHQGFVAMGQMSIDMLKASDGIYDASVGARSNETSGVAIARRQQEGDTATFDYQDKLSEGIQFTGELIGRALPKVYDTPRVVRVIGKDGGETWKTLYEEVRDEQTGEMVVVNDLSQGKYDYTVSTGPSYDTQRMEFVDVLSQMSQGNPQLAPLVADMIVGSMDFPKAEEAAERLKLMLPPPIQQAMQAKGKASPEVQQLQGQMQQMEQAAKQHIEQLMGLLKDATAKADSREADFLRVQIDAENTRIAWFKAETERMAMLQKDGHANDAQELALTKLMQADAHKAADLARPPAQPVTTSGDPAAQ